MFGRGDVEEGLVEGDRFDQRCLLLEYRHDRVRRFDVAIEVTRHVDPVRAEPSSDRERHRGPDAEGACLVGRGHHHAAFVRAIAADDHRFAAVLGMVALLD